MEVVKSFKVCMRFVITFFNLFFFLILVFFFSLNMLYVVILALDLYLRLE
jgi:hypothetical protein